MEFRVLGPVEVWDGGVRADVGHAKRKSVLAVLLLEPGRPVPVSTLLDRVWGHDPPDAALSSLYGYVTRLRQVLGPAGASLVRRSGGYLLDVDPEHVDVHRFRRLVAEATATGEPDRAADLFDEALALWRGVPFADAASPWLLTVRAALESERLSAVLGRGEAYLRAGRHGDLVGPLRELVAAHPTDERLAGQLMLALYRSGEGAAAADEYRHARARLARELGTEPGPALRELQQRILRGDRDLDEPGTREPAVVVRPSGVPHDVPHLVGREVELAWLDERLPAAEGGRAVVICAVDGTAGVGKTALAVHWAHRVRDRFPDGNLYADLHGFGPGPAADPAAVLDGFFAMLDVAPARIPADLAAKAALYRSLLDGRRMLVVLDNAASSEQVRPLLPGSPGCLVLVTSRDSLTGLVARDRAQRLSLDVLPLPEAVALLAGFLGADRVARESEAAAELAQLCARLPVALCVAGERAAPDEWTTVGELTEQLRTAARRLDLLEAGGDASTEVRAVFSWSYAALPADAARAFRLLGSSPVHRIDVQGVAALLGAEPPVASRLLQPLVRAHLARPAPGGRFGMHDLLREYAVERSQEEDGEAERTDAVARLLDHYAHSALVATELAFPGMRWTRPALGAPRAAVRSFPDGAAARAWLDAERANLVAATAYAADHGFPADAVHLGIVLWLSLFVGAHHAEARTVHGAALRAARATGDRAGEAVVLSGLGVLEIRVGRYEQARQAFEQSLAILRDLGDRAGEADVLGRLAGVYDAEARCEEGIELTRRALAIRQELGDRLGEAYALHNIGLMLTTLQRHDEAVAALQQALGIFEEAGSAHLLGAGLGALAYAHRRSGRYEQAVGDSLRSLELSAETGNRSGQCEQYAELGLAQWRLGRHDDALRSLEESLRLARDTGSRPREAEALCLLGRVRHDLDRGAAVEDLYQQALTIAREVRDDRLVASALNGLGEAYRAAGSPADAFREHSAALLLARRVSDQEEVPRALEGIADALDVQGSADLAREHLEEALLLYTQLHLPEAARVRDRLAQRRVPVSGP